MIKFGVASSGSVRYYGDLDREYGSFKEFLDDAKNLSNLDGHSHSLKFISHHFCKCKRSDNWILTIHGVYGYEDVVASTIEIKTQGDLELANDYLENVYYLAKQYEDDEDA